MVQAGRSDRYWRWRIICIGMSVPTNRSRDTCPFHKKQSNSAREQYAAKRQQTIAVCKQKGLATNNASDSANCAHVSRIRIAALREEESC